MKTLDIHTHYSSSTGSDGILSYSSLDGDIPEYAKYVSFSIHPWHLSEDNVSLQLENLNTAINFEKKIVAVGECGLDKVCKTPFKLQMYAFEEAAKAAKDNSLPLIIHSVKSSNEIIELRKRLGEDSVWIIHGFRGKLELAQMFLKHNIDLSFGEKYNTESLRSVPLNRLFIETDESKLSIDEIVQKVSFDYGVSSDILKREATKNVFRNFPLR